MKLTSRVALTVVDIAGLVGGAAAVLGVGGAVRGWWRRTVGRRRDRYRRLRRLGTGAQLDFFTSVLGEPPTIRRSIELVRTRYEGDSSRVESEAYTECYFVEPDHDVQALVDADCAVVAFSVTARSPWFRPTFQAPRAYGIARRIVNLGRYRIWWRPLLKVKLHRTRFANAVPSEREVNAEERYTRIRGWMGARTWFYSEAHDFGNPGHYQTFVLSASSAVHTRRADFEALGQVLNEYSEDFDDGTRSVTAAGKRFRRRSVVTTWSVLGPAMPLDEYRLNFGPHGDEIRTLV